MMMTHLSLNEECVMGILDKVAAIMDVVGTVGAMVDTSWRA
ncbi:hypothetical protein [Paraburkholderia bannensis]|nr:hypothetical protein [Paraburkholderia bannensis]